MARYPGSNLFYPPRIGLYHISMFGIYSFRTECCASHQSLLTQPSSGSAFAGNADHTGTVEVEQTEIRSRAPDQNWGPQ
eukprot:3245671-Rhodomonas_salina.3